MKLRLEGRKLHISGTRVRGITFTQAHLQTREIAVQRDDKPLDALKGADLEQHLGNMPVTMSREFIESVWLPKADRFSCVHVRRTGQGKGSAAASGGGEGPVPGRLGAPLRRLWQHARPFCQRAPACDAGGATPSLACHRDVSQLLQSALALRMYFCTIIAHVCA